MTPRVQLFIWKLINNLLPEKAL